MKALLNTYDPDARPNREQALFISQSKHLYLTKDGSLKRQDKELDPRTCGDKRLLTRYVALDVDTSQVYGEYHEAGEGQEDLLGFLARAWAKKPQNRMHGLPSKLNVPLVVSKNEVFAQMLRAVEPFGVVLGRSQGGFNAGIHAVKSFEQRAYEMTWATKPGDKLPFVAIQMASAIIGQQASSAMAHVWQEQWDALPEVPESFVAMVDACYKTPKAWSYGYYGYGIHGEVRWA